MWEQLRAIRSTTGRVQVALCLERLLWELHRPWSLWMIFRNFACRPQRTRPNMDIIQAGSSRLRRNRALISGTARLTTTYAMVFLMLRTGSTTTLEHRNLRFARTISAVHLVGRSRFQVCITEKTRRSFLSPMKGFG